MNNIKRISILTFTLLIITLISNAQRPAITGGSYNITIDTSSLSNRINNTNIKIDNHITSDYDTIIGNEIDSIWKVGLTFFIKKGLNTFTLIDSIGVGGTTDTGGWKLTGNTTLPTDYIGTNNAQPFTIKTNSTERVKVLGSGSVGINTNAPTTTLDINGDLRVRSLPKISNDSILGVDVNGVISKMQKPSGSSDTNYITTTYSALKTLMEANGLVAGRRYMMSDYQTIYAQPDYDAGGSIKTTLTNVTCNVEPLVLEATSSNTFAEDVYSIQYPYDAIKYNINDSITFDYGGSVTNPINTKGRIFERIDNNNNRTDYDHRKVMFKRYTDGTNFVVINDNGLASQDFMTFDTLQSWNNYMNGFYGVRNDLDAEFNNCIFTGFSLGNDISGDVSNNTFSGDVYSNTFSGYVNYNTFSGDVSINTFSGDVSNNTFSGIVYSNTFSGYVNYNTFSGDVSNNTFSGGVSINTFSGIVYSNTFSGDVSYNTFSGKVYNNTFSGKVNNNTFTYSTNLQYVDFKGNISSKTFTDVASPPYSVPLFGTNYKKEVLGDNAGNIYVKYLDSTIPSEIFIIVP